MEHDFDVCEECHNVPGLISSSDPSSSDDDGPGNGKARFHKARGPRGKKQLRAPVTRTVKYTCGKVRVVVTGGPAVG